MTPARLIVVLIATAVIACFLLACNSSPYVELGVSAEANGRPMDKTLAQAAFGTEWIYQAEYRKLIFDLRFQHKSDPDRNDDSGLDELEFNTRFYLD